MAHLNYTSLCLVQRSGWRHFLLHKYPDNGRVWFLGRLLPEETTGVSGHTLEMLSSLSQMPVTSGPSPCSKVAIGSSRNLTLHSL